MSLTSFIAVKIRALLRRTLNKVAYAMIRANRPICDSVIDASIPLSQVTVIAEAGVRERQLPMTVEAQVHEEFAQRTAYEVRQRYLFEIPNARLFGRDGLIILRDGHYLAETVYGKSELTQHRDYLSLILPKPKQLDGCYTSLLLGWWDNYFHWLFDVLPRLHGVLDRLPPENHFIAPASLRSYQRDALAALGIREAQIVLHPASEVWELETLYYTPPMSPSHRSPEAIQWVRDAIRTHLGLATPERGRKRIYISRSKASTRRVRNEADVETLLSRYGFETHLTETLTLAEQAHLFAEADMVIGAHGAGLANLMFAPEGTRVVEILPSNDVRSMYWEACDALAHQYHYLLAESRGPHADMSVDLGKLERTLARLDR